MKKVLIVYFSQTDTNKRVAETIAESLRTGGHQVTLYNLKDGPPPDPRDYDLLGVGSPTYYYRPPFIVTDYVRNLPDLSGLFAFVFVVHGTYRGNTGDRLRRALFRKQAKEIGYFHCHGAAYFLGYLKEGYLISSGHPTVEEIDQAAAFGRKLTARLAGEPYEKEPADPPLPMIYRFERFLTHRVLAKQVYSRLFAVNEKCRPDCDVCISQCPMHNITRATDGRLVWGRNCLLCLSCELKCPEDAVTSPASWSIFKPFMIYNTRHAARDPSLDYERVIHKRGQTRRL